jgi:hypothetical protein
LKIRSRGEKKMQPSKEPRPDAAGSLTRRDLLCGVGLSAGGLMLLGPPVLFGSSAAQGATVIRAVSRGPAALELDGVQSYVISVEGGNAVGSVVTEASVGGAVPGKHIGGVSFEDIVVQLPFTVAPTLAAWIGDTLAKGPARKNGAIVYTDINRSEWKRLEFTDALISGVELPACDASQEYGVPDGAHFSGIGPLGRRLRQAGRSAAAGQDWRGRAKQLPSQYPGS